MEPYHVLQLEDKTNLFQDYLKERALTTSLIVHCSTPGSAERAAYAHVLAMRMEGMPGLFYVGISSDLGERAGVPHERMFASLEDAKHYLEGLVHPQN